jgi:FAD/FMN-containing dehydrogenase
VAGLTLGGGLGYLTRRFGWTVDVYGGLVAWPFERAAEVLAAYRELTAAAPRELAVWQLLLPAPPAPFVPAEWHGRRICAMAVCYSGDLDDTERVLAPIRALGEPLVDLLGRRPYTEVQSYLDDTEPSGRHYYWKTEFLAGLDDELLAGLRELFAACPIPEADLGLLHLGGALNERAGDDGAVGNRDARYVVGVKGMWSPGEPAADRFREWVRDAGARLRPFSTGATYVNFQTADEGDGRVRATYGANYGRLVEVKRRYDPGNLFRGNRNIRP